MATTKTPKATAAAKEPAAPKKTAEPKKSAAPKAAAEKKPAAKKETGAKKTAAANSPFERYKMIEVAAYYIAEKDNFQGHAADYWVAAEKEVDKKLAKK